MPERSVSSGARSVQTITKDKNLSSLAAATHQSILRWVDNGLSLLVGLVLFSATGFALRKVLMAVDRWLNARTNLPRYGSLALVGALFVALWLCWQTGKELRNYLADRL